MFNQRVLRNLFHVQEICWIYPECLKNAEQRVSESTDDTEHKATHWVISTLLEIEVAPYTLPAGVQ